MGVGQKWALGVIFYEFFILIENILIILCIYLIALCILTLVN